MANVSTYAIAAIAFASLSACGGSTTTFVDLTPPFTQDLRAFDAASSAQRALPESSAAAVANASGNYTGTAQLSVLGSGATPTFLGDASLNANIATGRVSGTLTAFRGGTDQTSPEMLAGTVTVTGNSIGSGGASAFSSSYTGTLTGPETTIILGSGSLNGDFRASPTTGLYASGVANGTTLNGVTGRAAVLNVTADKQ